MKVIVQKVLSASCTVDDKITGQIEKGFMLLVGFTHTDTLENVTATTTIVPRLIVVSGDLTADYLENPPYVVQAIGDDGNPVGENEKVTFNINGVFYNRLNSGWTLGSDVTTYYAAKVDMSERDLYQKELDRENPYNTRGPNMEGKLPIGPISSVSKNSINAKANLIYAINSADFDIKCFQKAAKSGKSIGRLILRL